VDNAASSLLAAALAQKKHRDFMETRAKTASVVSDDGETGTGAPTSVGKQAFTSSASSSDKHAPTVPASTEPAEQDEQEEGSSSDVETRWTTSSSRASRSRPAACRSTGRKRSKLARLEALVKKKAAENGDVSFQWKQENPLTASSEARAMSALVALAPAPPGASDGTQLPLGSVLMERKP
jgi:hypothetical protein